MESFKPYNAVVKGEAHCFVLKGLNSQFIYLFIKMAALERLIHRVSSSYNLPTMTGEHFENKALMQMHAPK